MDVVSITGVLRKLGTAGAIAGFLAVGIAASAQSGKVQRIAPPRSVQALFVSDIHFEPFWDPAKAAKLAAAPVNEWNSILGGPASPDRDERWSAVKAACPTRGEDATFPLYESSLTAIEKNAGAAKFVIVGGDLISHSFPCKFAAVFPHAAPGEYGAFVEKTIAFIVGSLREALPGAKLYAALGNNDSDCGDYHLDAEGPFLAAESDVFTRGFPEGERERAAKSFANGGYYGVTLPPPMEHTRLLVLDDLFMSRRYQTCGGEENHAYADQQVAWLEEELNAARKNGEKVWVMAHIPPGVDAYSTATKGANICGGKKPVMFLSSEVLPETLAKYGDVVKLAIFAHTHMDEVRLLKPEAGGSPRNAVAVKLVPSISPVNGNNPAFTVATIDPASATMKDYRVIAASNKTGIEANWTEEYDFANAYQEPEYSATALQDLIGRFDKDPGAQTSASQNFIRNYEVGEPLRALSLFWPQYVCAMKNDSGEAFAKCACSTMK